MSGATKHDNRGNKNPNYKHGLRGSRLYTIYSNMIQRCENTKHPMYSYYGEKGIKLCHQWKESFLSFYKWANANEYSEELTIDRIDGSKDYSPDNCRWTTKKVQADNRKKFSNNTSGYTGINLRPNGKFQVQINIDKKHKVLGTFDYPWTAALARDSYIVMNNLPNITNYNTKG